MFGYLKSRKSRHGFTLLEVLLALMIGSGVFSLLSMELSAVARLQLTATFSKAAEWHLFLNQFQHDVDQLNFSYVSAGEIGFLDPSGTKVRYYQYSSNLIRNKNGGYEPYLTNIKSLVFDQDTKDASQIKMTVTFLNGQIFQARIQTNRELTALVHKEVAGWKTRTKRSFYR